MNLDFFNNLINNAKENIFVQNFLKELGEYMKNNITNNLRSNSSNEISLLNKLCNENNVTAEYRDKMHINRSTILQNYAKQTEEDGIMYFVYDKTDNNYLISICDENKSHEIIKIKENELPQGASVDSVLRFQNGEYILDKDASKYVKELMLESFNELLEEQKNNMDMLRVDGHIYEFIESSGDSIWLIDNTANSNEGFEEFNFNSQIFDNAKEGDLFQYSNETYQKYFH